MPQSSTTCRLTYDAVLRHRFQERLRKPIPVPIHPRVQVQQIAAGGSKSAVLIPLIEVDRQAHILFTHRSLRLSTHRGELCFPGGKLEAGETCAQAALRETVEEIGVEGSKVEVWGKLQPMANRNFTGTVTPVVAALRDVRLDEFRIDIDEVQTVFTVPVQELFAKQQYTTFRKGGIRYRLPVFFCSQYKIATTVVNPLKQYRIWGLTAGMLHMALLHLFPTMYKSDFKFVVS